MDSKQRPPCIWCYDTECCAPEENGWLDESEKPVVFCQMYDKRLRRKRTHYRRCAACRKDWPANKRGAV